MNITAEVSTWNFRKKLIFFGLKKMTEEYTTPNGLMQFIAECPEHCCRIVEYNHCPKPTEHSKYSKYFKCQTPKRTVKETRILCLTRVACRIHHSCSCDECMYERLDRSDRLHATDVLERYDLTNFEITELVGNIMDLERHERSKVLEQLKYFEKLEKLTQFGILAKLKANRPGLRQKLNSPLSPISN